MSRMIEVCPGCFISEEELDATYEEIEDGSLAEAWEREVKEYMSRGYSRAQAEHFATEIVF